MNVYDFDQTIYAWDSTADFYFFCLKKQPSLLRHLPAQGFAFLRYLLGGLNKTQFKERFYRFMGSIPDIEQRVEQFWDTHAHKIEGWYLAQQQADDVVISASPEFLLRPICARLGITHLMASRVDPKSGTHTGLNCHGREKVCRYREALGEAPIKFFYSDSLSDTPLAELAQYSYIVRRGCLIDWQKYGHSSRKRLRKLRHYADTPRFL